MRSADFQSVAVGFFDGVHLGHQSILKGAEAALTFRNHPLAVLSPDRAPRLLMDVGERLAAIRACGLKEIVALDFTTEFARLSPEEFLATAGISRETKIRCGANWRFGRGGTADATWLREHGYSVEVVSAVEYRGESVSSTRIVRGARRDFRGEGRGFASWLSNGELKAEFAQHSASARRLCGRGWRSACSCKLWARADIWRARVGRAGRGGSFSAAGAQNAGRLRGSEASSLPARGAKV